VKTALHNFIRDQRHFKSRDFISQFKTNFMKQLLELINDAKTGKTTEVSRKKIRWIYVSTVYFCHEHMYVMSPTNVSYDMHLSALRNLSLQTWQSACDLQQPTGKTPSFVRKYCQTLSQ
jgi:lantibiotic modifying enzyme